MILSTMTAAVRRTARVGLAGRAVAARGHAATDPAPTTGARCLDCVATGTWAAHSHATGATTRVGAVRAFARSARSAPKLVSFSKQQRKKRAPAMHATTQFEDVNDPRMTPKHLRHAARVARKLGTDRALAEFDEASAAFPNPAPIVAATLLEREPIVMRAPEEWEGDFLEFQAMVDEKYAKEYPPEFLERQEAFAAKLEAEQGGGADMDQSRLQTRAEGGGTSSFSQFYAGDDAIDEDSDDDEVAEADFQPLPRHTHADTINDRRSLDRALQERLVLLVKRKSDGKWGLPTTEREDGERMVEAARRALKGAWGADVDAWYPGNAPMGHQLRVYDAAQQEETKTYGAKEFIYRGILITGKIELGSEYEDFVWVHRDEAVEYLDADDFLYLHQVMGGDSPTEDGKGRARLLQEWTEAQA